MKTHRMIKLIAALSAMLLLGLLIGRYADRVRLLTEKAALLSVGMQHPDESASLLGERVQAAVAKAQPTVPVASVTTTVTSATVTTTRVTTTATTPTKGAGGTVLTQSLASTAGAIQGVAVRNRSGKAFDVTKELARGTSIKLQTHTKEPQVLIVHTHTTENYLTYDTGFYNQQDVQRTKDMTRNICAAGAATARALEQAGVAVIHDTTIHDNPKYTGAYGRSEQTVKALLKKYPSVKVVLDLHRDAIMPQETVHVKPTGTVNGKKAAQMMIIAGVVSTDALPHPNWQQNLSFAFQLQKALATEYPDLMRPLSIVSSRYNQHLSTGYLLIEMGSDVNTVDEAVYSGELLGKTIAKLLAK